jgi:ferredoxin
MKVRINERKCQGFGLCALAAPNLFVVGEFDGYAYIALPKDSAGTDPLSYVRVAAIPHDKLEAAKVAAENCPTHAIEILSEEEP